jgi:ATP-dependent RNA helicase RhlE
MSQYKNRAKHYSNSRNSRSNRSHFATSRRRNVSKHGQYIDPSKFVKTAKNGKQAEYQADYQFNDFAINQLLQNNLAKNGYINPSAIQDKTIGLALEGKDIIGIADTGTGKTAAFALPVLNKLIENNHAKALVIAPTRELAQQIEQECRKLAKNSGLCGAVVIGGANISPQLRDLRNNPQIVIGTPGRIKDHLERQSLNLSKFNLVVVDEVDRLLDMGFAKDVTNILSKLSQKRQSFFFSATMDYRVNSLIRKFSNQPVTVSIKTSDTSDNVHQDVVKFDAPYEKLDKLHDILIQSEAKKNVSF